MCLCLIPGLVSCSDNSVGTNPSQNHNGEQTKDIIFVASSLVLPENSAFSFQFLENNESLGGIKTVLPTCGNGFINDLILSTIKTRISAFLPNGTSPAAVDIEDCKKAGDAYSFSFAIYYNTPENERAVVRFWLTADVSQGKLLALGDFIKSAYFEKGIVDKYTQVYLKEIYLGKYDVQKAESLLLPAESVDNFYVCDAGVVILLSDKIGAESELEIYISDSAIVLFNRKGEVSTTEPSDSFDGNYEPAKDGEKVIAMTFDDGPGSTSTNRLLDYIDANDIKVTFFVNGYNYSNLEKDEIAKAKLRRAVELGCEIGNHSYSHPYFHNLTPEQRTYQLEHNADLIEEACGVYPNIFRAPGGIFPLGMPESEDYFYIYWNADGEDWKYKSENDPQALAQRYLNLIGSGSIVLFHDIYSNSVDAAIIVMNTLKAQGYRFVTVSELLDLRNKVPDGTIYTSQYGTRNYMNVEKNG